MNEVDYFARFDGACWPNPGGHASAACVICQGRKPVFKKSEFLGRGLGMTNNVAEFTGLLFILEWLRDNNPKATAVVYSDSQIVVNRMNSRTLPSGQCREVAEKCLAVIDKLSDVRLAWQERGFNRECDAMCKAEIEKAGGKIESARRKEEEELDRVLLNFWK